jgi:ATP synthase protein I
MSRSGTDAPFPFVRRNYTAFAAYGTVGLELVLSILLGLFAGRWVDDRVGTRGPFAIFGFLIGVIAGFRFIYRAAKRLEAETTRDEEENPPPGDPPN